MFVSFENQFLYSNFQPKSIKFWYSSAEGESEEYESEPDDDSQSEEESQQKSVNFGF